MRRHFGAVAVGVAMAATLMVPAAASASPIDPLVLVSYDGDTFTASATVDLFSAAGAVVPGDAIIQDVWIKNATTAAGRLRIDIINVRANDTDFAEAVTVNLGTESSQVRVSDAVDAGSCLVMMNDVVLEPGAVIQLPAEMAVDAILGERQGDQGSEGQGASVSFQLRALLSDAAVPSDVVAGDACTVVPDPEAPPATTQPSPPSTAAPNLPATGAADVSVIAVSAVAAMIAGAFAIARHRRTKIHD